MSEINVVITAAKRTAVGSLNKSLKNVKAEDLGSSVITSVINDSKLKATTLMKLLWDKF